MDDIIIYFIVGFIILLPIVFCIVMSIIYSGQCPKCEKLHALELINENKIDELTSSKTKKVLKPILDKYGKETGQFFETTENELETYDVYNVIYKCKYCGHIVEHKKEKIRWK